MAAELEVNKDCLFANGPTDPEVCIGVKRTLRRIGHHLGQGSYGPGPTVVVNARFLDEFGITLSNNSALWLQTFEDGSKNYLSLPGPTFSFFLPAERAPGAAPVLAIVFVGRVPDAVVYRARHKDPGTVADPTEINVESFYIHFELSKIRILDTRTGSVAAEFNRATAR
jgi:hypothetical protein